MTTAPIVRPAATPTDTESSSEPRLTKNQQTMSAILHAAGAGGLDTETWNDRARREGVGVKRKADLYDIREALKSKNTVREFNGRWNVSNYSADSRPGYRAPAR